MKKLFLIFTFWIYIFSILTEAGLFSLNHTETEVVAVLSDISNETLVAKALQDANENSHCAEESCHVGHCHHVSTLLNRNFHEQHLKQILNGKLNLLSYQNPFLDGLKRPPRRI